MANTTLITLCTTLGTVLLLICIILLITYCYTQFYYNPSKSKPEPMQVSTIMNQHCLSDSSISIINGDYHNSTTLLAPERRLAILELQQETSRNPTQTFAYENASFHTSEFNNTRTMRF